MLKDFMYEFVPNSTQPPSFFFRISEPALSLVLLCQPSQKGNNVGKKWVGDKNKKEKNERVMGGEPGMGQRESFAWSLS